MGRVNKETLQNVTAAALAVITVGGAMLILAYQVINGKPGDLPQWVLILIGGITGAYYNHVASVNGARNAGVAAAQTTVDRITPPIPPPPLGG